MTRISPNLPLHVRLRENSDIDSTTGCWVWRGWKTQHVGRAPYGMTKVDGQVLYTHRASYLTFKGPIPKDMTVDHICFNSLCVNPEHLQLLTRADNARRSQRVLAGECRRGHKMTPENSYYRPDRPGSRWCQTCARARNRSYRAGGAA